MTVEQPEGGITTASFPCTKGCGIPIDVETQMIVNMAQQGKALEFSHTVCPNARMPADPDQPMRKFRLQILVWEVGHLAEVPEPADGAFNLAVHLQGMGRTVEARSLKEAMTGPLNDWLSTRSMVFQQEPIQPWDLLMRASAFADPLPSSSAPTAQD
jgi:hypothetical protein